VTLDDPLTRLAAQNDPVGLIRSYDRVVVDEIQRVPELYLSIKKAVDDDRRPGRFLLTGSANLMAIPQAADSLAGGMETLQLLPLLQSEIHGVGGNWVDAVFSGTMPTISSRPDPMTWSCVFYRGGIPRLAVAPACDGDRRNDRPGSQNGIPVYVSSWHDVSDSPGAALFQQSPETPDQDIEGAIS